MSPASLIAAFYFTFFAGLGIFLPYFALWLTSRGLAPSEATRVVGLTPLMSLLAPPLFGLVADARRARVWLLRGGALATAVAFSGFLRAEGRVALYVTTALFAFCRAPLTALADAAALENIARHGGSYGALRLWGSLGFLIAAVAGGVLYETQGLPSLIGFTTFALALCAACAFALPAPPPVKRDVSGAWHALVADRELRLFFAAVMMAQVAMAAYDSAFTLHLTRLGFHGRFIGIAWATGVAAEIVLMAASPYFLHRVGAPRLLTFSIAVAAVRWLALSRITSAALILALQPLHGITFGLFWVSSIIIVRDRGAAAPTTAQGLLSAAMGIGSLLGMNVAGTLLESGGGRKLYTVAAGAALLGALLAALFSRRSRRRATLAS